MTISVIHRSDESKFVVDLNGENAELLYRLESDNGVNFYRTFVPASHRGRGIAEALVRAGLSWARSEQFDVQADCWYVQKFLK